MPSRRARDAAACVAGTRRCARSPAPAVPPHSWSSPRSARSRFGARGTARPSAGTLIVRATVSFRKSRTFGCVLRYRVSIASEAAAETSLASHQSFGARKRRKSEGPRTGTGPLVILRRADPHGAAVQPLTRALTEEKPARPLVILRRAKRSCRTGRRRTANCRLSAVRPPPVLRGPPRDFLAPSVARKRRPRHLQRPRGPRVR